MLYELLNRIRIARMREIAKEHCKVKRYAHFITWAYTLEDDFDFEWYERFFAVADYLGLKPFHVGDTGFIDGAYHYTIAVTGSPEILDNFYSIMWFNVEIPDLLDCEVI